MAKKLYPARIDGKDVSTDWIESIFDDAECMHVGHTFIGFVRDTACSCYVQDNQVYWNINTDCGGNEYLSYVHLVRMLNERDKEDLSHVVKYGYNPERFKVTQLFYFVEEE